LEISIGLKDRSEQTDGIVRILYASGTLTHQKDFAVAISALCRILSDYSNVKLMLIGLFKLEEFPNLDPFSDRIEKYDVVPWRVLPSLMAKADINVAPLEMNPYTNSKSELKYFEAAVLKIPTVATPTPAFKRAIKHGENGFLAENEDEWYARLKDLVLDIKLRQEVGEAAFSHAISHYSPVILGQKIKSTYSAIICDYLKCRDVSRERLSISMVIPPPFSGSGGHNKIFEIADFLQNRGHSVNIFSSSPSHKFGSDQEFVDFIRAKFGFSFTSYIGINKVRPCDILMATHHSTAYSVAEMIKSCVAGFYFVQDYEPYFVPMGEEYIRAENSRKQAKSPVTWIPFYLNKEKYHPIETIQRSKTRLIYFARPDMPRRCFHLGADALNLFHKILPDVEIVLFGTNYLPKEKKLFPYQDMGVLDQSSLVKLYNSSTAALCFTTTNPSMAPFEIMACGCPVVDLDFNDNDITYGERANVFLVPPDAKSIAKELAFLFQNEGIRQKIALNGSKYVREKMASPEEALKRFEEILWHGIRFAEQNDLSYLFGTNR
jgi:glycosyltransferase involved in cell wall biosynthesis